MTGNITVKVARRRRPQGDDVVEILDAADDAIETGEAELEDEGLDLIDLTEEPDVIVLDLDVAGPEALEATQRIATEHPSARPPERLALGTARERMLTEREVEILALLSSERSDEDVAEYLGVTSATVRRNRRASASARGAGSGSRHRACVPDGGPSRGADLVWIPRVPRSEDEDRI